MLSLKFHSFYHFFHHRNNLKHKRERNCVNIVIRRTSAVRNVRAEVTFGRRRHRDQSAGENIILILFVLQ